MLGFSQENFRILWGNWPISTLLLSISFRVRRRIAESRTGTIIRRILTSRFTELGVVVVIATAALIAYGSNGEGQTSFLRVFIQRYIEETALAVNIPHSLSASQLADMNSVFAGTGGDGAASPSPSNDVPTINGSALMALTPPDSDYLNRISEDRAGITTYTVQEGDLLSFIASDFGVSQLSLIWANNLKNADSISPGQILRIPPVSGVIHKVKSGDTAESLAKKYGADAARIIAYNRLPKNGSLNIGDEVIIPDGRMSQTNAPVVKKTSTVASSFSHLPNLGDYFKIPTFGFNWGRIHGRNGVDVANSCGTAVLAAADGIVTVADSDGYNGGFGKYIKISHPNGTETLYAHSMKLLVSVGQAIAKGDKIMLMGTTGRSTGCHLHFEVHGARNPLAKY